MTEAAQKISHQRSGFDVDNVRKDFLQLSQTKVHDKPLIYLDSAASTLKPKAVVDVLTKHYQLEASNIHRGVHLLSEQGTTAYEDSRKKVQQLLNAKEDAEIIFTRGTTDSLNLVAQSYGRAFLQPGDEVLITEMEHHSNIVPWQILCEEKGCILKVLPMSDKGELLLDQLDNLLSERTKIVSVVHTSNSLGTVNPIKTLIDKAHAVGAITVIDGAQAVAHDFVDVQALDCDFFAFSGHKIFGPTGIGVLYGKRELLEKMPPVDGGGDMIDTVTFEKTTYNVIPHKFEAGTPHIAGVLGLGAAIDYVQMLGLENIAHHEQTLLSYATEKIQSVPGLRVVGTAKNKGAVLAFVVEGTHPHDLGTLLDMEGIAIRTGHHCTQPIMKHFGVPATARASFAVYNTKEDVDVFIKALQKVIEMLR